MSSNRYILDSSAVLAVLYEEIGAALVEKLLHQSVISAVNLSEIIARLSLDGAPSAGSQKKIVDMVQEVVPFDEESALLAGQMAPLTKRYGLSFGDRACLATAEQLRLEAVTADKVWGKLELSVKIRVIR